MRRIVLVLGLAFIAALAGGAPSDAATFGAAEATWHVLPTLTTAITPNYQSGFGPQGGTGSGSTPAVGASAVLDGGYVDFGTVVAGYNYLYKYAAQVQVKTNDNSGFKVFAEGSADFYGTTTMTTQPMNSVLFWALSGTGNSPFTAATPFQSTANTGDTPTNFITTNGTNQGQNITFASGPPSSTLIYSSSTGGTNTQGYDYQIHVPDTVPTDTFSAIVVYTAVAN
jgi:hypothetical protein